MLDYTGIKCPVCGVPFGKDDDIVVCPECGAPYHRECYVQAGRCIFEESHGPDWEWQPPQPKLQEAHDPSVSAEIKDVECPVCGTLNGKSALYCNRCGSPLSDRSRAGQAPYGAMPQRPVYTPAAPPFAFDPMGGVNPTESLEGDVTYGDASKVVKHNTNYYMPVFRYIRQTGKNKFNFSAFLFSGFWMLYRKQYRWGAVVTSLMFVLFMAYLYTMYVVALPTMLALGAEAGFTTEQFLGLTQEQIAAAISPLAAADPTALLRICTPLFVLLAGFILMLVVGVRGNRMYLDHCVSEVRTLKLEMEEGDVSALERKGGINPMLPACIAIGFFIAYTVALTVL